MYWLHKYLPRPRLLHFLISAGTSNHITACMKHKILWSLSISVNAIHRCNFISILYMQVRESYWFLTQSCVQGARSGNKFVGILEGCWVQREILMFAALPQDKWIGANTWGIGIYIQCNYTKTWHCHTKTHPPFEVLTLNIQISNKILSWECSHIKGVQNPHTERRNVTTT